MANIYVYLIDLPDRVDEMVTPCMDGYTVYINAKLSYIGRTRAYCHALKHIGRNDWNKENVQIIESEAHKNQED